MLLPSAFMIFGVWLSSIDFNYRSDPRLLTPSLYPLKQKLYMNEFVYDQADSNKRSSSILAENLPDYENAFDVTYMNEPKGKTFDNFALNFFNFGTKEAAQQPYMYGSYEVFQVNTDDHEYKFVTHVNMTSTASVILYPQFMYESILKVATGDPEFEFKTKSTPYPLTHELNRR